MSLTYGYDLKDGDKILEAPVQVAKLLAPLVRPGAALINYLPFCIFSNFILVSSFSHSYFQCGTFLLGSHTLATNQWHGKAES
jgi:hypothetical protein